MLKQSYSKEDILNFLSTRADAVEHAIVTVYNNQMEDEKRDKKTAHYNKIGFSAPHARMMSDFAEQLIKGKKLTSKQLEFSRPIMTHYWKQILNKANERAMAVKGSGQ